MAWLARPAVRGRQIALLLHFPGPWQLNLHRVPSSSMKLFIVPPPFLCSQCHRYFTSPSGPTVPVSGSSTEFRNIYTFRFIVHTRVVSRLKIYQTFLTLGAIPPAIVMHSSGVLSALGLASFFGVASVATVMLYVMSNLFRHIVGIISFDDKKGIVRISHLTFWGRRQDEEFDVSGIVPLSDTSVKADDIYQVIQFYDKPVKFYWFLHHAKQADPETIEKIFGKIL